MQRPAPAFESYKLRSAYAPCGDQPQAIAQLTQGLHDGEAFQTLLGVTGSGKTFTIANVLANVNRPALVIAPNKTLAAQLYNEFKEFFPENRVRYFVSYYDYYQPEAYIPSTNTYIEKDAATNEEIDKLRHSATRSILEGSDTIVVASVSCIYGLGAPEDYFNLMLFVEVAQQIDRDTVIRKLVSMQYTRTDQDFGRGNFRVRGETIDIFPSDNDREALRIIFFGDEIEQIAVIDGLSGQTLKRIERCAVYPLSHFVTQEDAIKRARHAIVSELQARLSELRTAGKTVEAQRLESRVLYDLEVLEEVGFCAGIENYSRHLTGRSAGTPPTTLLDYFPSNFVLVIDESHVTLSQLGGMYRGDRARKQTLVEYGFRLPSALDNRPLNGEEFWQRVSQAIFVSATPGDKELELSGKNIVEQVNRPTGLLDPEVSVRPATNQVDDLVAEIRKNVALGERVLVTTLTKRMSEDLSNYLRDLSIKCRYLHSDINAIDRVEILRGLRRGDFDVLIGINLLREGLDLVEVSLVAILDADKEGFLRSTRSLIQTMGRAARNLNGRVILYADIMTDSMRSAIAETDRRRKIQAEFNAAHGIIPRSATSAAPKALVQMEDTEIATITAAVGNIALPDSPSEQQKLIAEWRKEMYDAAKKRDFEHAAKLRDAIKALEGRMLEIA